MHSNIWGKIYGLSSLYVMPGFVLISALIHLILIKTYEISAIDMLIWQIGKLRDTLVELLAHSHRASECWGWDSSGEHVGSEVHAVSEFDFLKRLLWEALQISFYAFLLQREHTCSKHLLLSYPRFNITALGHHTICQCVSILTF